MKIARVLRNLSKRSPIEVQPVYVLNPSDFNLVMEFQSPAIKNYIQAAENSIESTLREIDVPNLRKSHVVVQRIPSITQAVRTLIKNADLLGADLIVSATHARHGLPRIFLGSFTETLLLESKIPVLTVNPLLEPTDFDKILFPTDFGAPSEKLWRSAIDVASQLQSELTLLHVFPNPVEPVFQTGVYIMGGGWMPVYDYLEKTEDENKKIAKRWVESARRSGVTAHYVFDEGREGLRQVILNHSKIEKSGLIMMAAQSGRAASALIGSVSRQMVREASCPVWILRQR